MKKQDFDEFKIINGVYCIRNKINDKRYIGSSWNIYDRWYMHKIELNENRHYNRHLQNAWNKYGEDAFEFSVIEIIALDVEDCYQYEIDRLSKEKEWVKKFNTLDRKYGYNLKEPINNTYMMKESDLKEGKALITYDEFCKITDLLINTDLSLQKVSEATNVSFSKILGIYYKKTYRRLTENMHFQSRSLRKNYDKMENQLKEEIFSMIDEGKGYRFIANKFNLSIKAVKSFCEE